MIYLTLGIIIGLLIAILCIVTLLYFKKVIVQKIEVIENKLDEAGPGPTGDIFIPEDEADEEREEIIKRNQKKGRYTRMEELI